MKIKAKMLDKHIRRDQNQHRHGGECCGWVYERRRLHLRARVDHRGIKLKLKTLFPSAKITITKY